MIRSAAHFVRLAVLLAGATAPVTAQTPAPAPLPAPAASGSRMITPNFTPLCSHTGNVRPCLWKFMYAAHLLYTPSRCPRCATAAVL